MKCEKCNNEDAIRYFNIGYLCSDCILEIETEKINNPFNQVYFERGFLLGSLCGLEEGFDHGYFRGSLDKQDEESDWRMKHIRELFEEIEIN
jgi:hypothetical protein